MHAGYQIQLLVLCSLKLMQKPNKEQIKTMKRTELWLG